MGVIATIAGKGYPTWQSSVSFSLRMMLGYTHATGQFTIY